MSTGPRQPIIKQSNYYTGNVYTRGEIGSSHTSPRNIMVIDFEWTRRQHISLYLLRRLIHVSFYLPALMPHCTLYALFSAASKGSVCCLCRCREPRQDDALLTDDLPSLLWVTMDPTNCIHITEHTTNTDKTKGKTPLHSHMRIPTKASYEWMCTRTAHIWLCCKIRAAQTSETQTDNQHQPAVYSSLIPFGAGYWHQTLSHCWACTNFATMFKDIEWVKQVHANKSSHPESKLT